jgi:hypothetical protein
MDKSTRNKYKSINTEIGQLKIPTAIEIMERTRPSAKSNQFLRDYKNTLSNPKRYQFYRPSDLTQSNYQYHWGQANANILTRSQMDDIVYGKEPKFVNLKDAVKESQLTKLPEIASKCLVETVTETVPVPVIEPIPVEEAPIKKKKKHRKHHHHHRHRKPKLEPLMPLEPVEAEPIALIEPEDTIENIESKEMVMSIDLDQGSQELQEIEEGEFIEEEYESNEEIDLPLVSLENVKLSKEKPLLAPINTSKIPRRRKPSFKLCRRATYISHYGLAPPSTGEINAGPEAVRGRSDKYKVLWNYATFAIAQQHRLKSIPNMANVQPFANIGYHVSDNDWLAITGKLLRSIATCFDLHDGLITFQHSEQFDDGDVTSLKVDDLLRTVESLDKLKPAVRSHIAATARLETHCRGTPLFRENGDVTTVYYLLCGLCVEHQTTPQQEQELLKYYASGDCVGDFIGNSVVRRRSSTTVLMRSLFLCVEKADWIMAMKRGNSEAIMFESISSLPMFATLPTPTLQKFADLCVDTKVVAGEVMCTPHEEPKQTYFIVKGKCSYTLNIPFVKTIKDNSLGLIAPSEYQVILFH